MFRRARYVVGYVRTVRFQWWCGDNVLTKLGSLSKGEYKVLEEKCIYANVWKEQVHEGGPY